MNDCVSCQWQKATRCFLTLVEGKETSKIADGFFIDTRNARLSGLIRLKIEQEVQGLQAFAFSVVTVNYEQAQKKVLKRECRD